MWPVTDLVIAVIGRRLLSVPSPTSTKKKVITDTAPDAVVAHKVVVRRYLIYT